MGNGNSREFLAFPAFDLENSVMVREPEVKKQGYWVGAPSIFEKSGVLYLTYRVRRPIGDGRGIINRIARSTNGIDFEDVFEINKKMLGDTPSIERSCVVHTGSSFRLYFSYVNPENKMWQIDYVEAETVEKFDLASRKKVLDGNMIGSSGVKDPWILKAGDYYMMYVSYAPLPPKYEPGLHATGDAFATGLTTSHSGLAISRDGIHFKWNGEVIGLGDEWDSSTTRISSIARINGGFVAFYDGASKIEENYEERCGIAFGADLKTFNRLSVSEPYIEGPKGESIRYVDTVMFGGSFLFYFEKTRDDGSHELRVAKVESFRW